MARQCFRTVNVRPKTRELMDQCVAITEEYMAAGYALTLRQLYYQLVSRALIPNEEKSYRRVGKICTQARMGGFMDWDAIEDRVRQPSKHPEWDNLHDLAEAALASYRLPRWQTQPCYAELWVEKDALSAVLKPIADNYHVTLMVNRGYSSASAMKNAAERLLSVAGTQDLFIFYLGDLDPSGEDMVRDIRDRLNEFGVYVTVKKVALTIEQVREYDPPPNPAKLTDSGRSRLLKGTVTAVGKLTLCLLPC